PLYPPLDRFRDVAQPGSALAWGARGREFKSRRPDQTARSLQWTDESCLPVHHLGSHRGLQAGQDDPAPTGGRTHGAEVVGMFFFDDNAYMLRRGDPLGERLAKVAREKNIWLGVCDMCALDRGLAAGEPVWCQPDRQAARPAPAHDRIRLQNAIEGLHVGCFPDVYQALSGNPPDLVISL